MAAAFPAGNITGQSFKGEDWTEVTAGGSHVSQCTFTDCTFDVAIFTGLIFDRCKFSHCSFQETQFRDCIFLDAETSVGCIWGFCNLANASFTKCNLGMCKIHGSEAYLASFTECAAAGMSFQAVVHKPVSRQLLLGGVSFTDCKLQYATFENGQYEESKFENCDLRDVSFAGSNLRGASFGKSNLINTDFSNAVLDAAILSHATLEGLPLGAMASYKGLVISRSQHDTILESLGLHLID